MRALIVIVALGLIACSKKADEGAEEARREAEREQKEKEAKGGVAAKIKPPVPGGARIKCEQLLDVAAFGEKIGEIEPMSMKDISDPEAAASCSLVRGGTPLTAKEQKEKAKKEGRLGVLPGDEVCNVSALCWTLEEAEAFRKKCEARGKIMDETMGTFACVTINPQGRDDPQIFEFYDEDTKCVLRVRGGPSNVDNDLIRKCAVAARDMVGPAQIAIGGAPAAPKTDEAKTDEAKTDEDKTDEDKTDEANTDE